jgi:hypothetical protein
LLLAGWLAMGLAYYWLRCRAARVITQPSSD